MREIKFLAVLFLYFLFLTTGSVCGEQKEETIDKMITIDASRPVEFDFIENDGNVRFSTWDREEIHILIRKEAKSANGRRVERLLKDTKVDITQNRNSVRLHIRYPRVRGFFFITDIYRVKVTSEIRIPVRSNLTCRSDDGDIVIESAEGEFDLITDDGTIRVLNSRGSLEANTDDGRVILENFTGAVKIDSDDGDQLLSGSFDSLNLESDDGDVTIRNREQSVMKADWTIETNDGDVDISISEDIAADVRINTDDGSIDNFLPIVFRELTSKTHLSGKLNEGGFLISIRTDDGDITLRQPHF